MYTATMEYHFIDEHFEKGCELWKEIVLGPASRQEGLVSMQFLVQPPRAMAIGTWKGSTDALDFMQTGIFKNLMAQIEPMLAGQPVPRIWDTRYTAGE